SARDFEQYRVAARFLRRREDARERLAARHRAAVGAEDDVAAAQALAARVAVAADGGDDQPLGVGIDADRARDGARQRLDRHAELILDRLIGGARRILGQRLFRLGV